MSAERLLPILMTDRLLCVQGDCWGLLLLTAHSNCPPPVVHVKDSVVSAIFMNILPPCDMNLLLITNFGTMLYRLYDLDIISRLR